jgi:hypothetical protein
MYHRFGAGDRGSNAFACSKVPLYPLNGRVATRLAREHADVMTALLQTCHDRATKMASASRHENLHALSFLGELVFRKTRRSDLA